MSKLKLVLNLKMVGVLFLVSNAYATCTPNVSNTSSVRTGSLNPTADGDCVLNSGNIQINTDNMFGINSEYTSVTINNLGSITTSSNYSYGIMSLGANATITNLNSGSITTSEQSTDGIHSEASYSTITNAGSITTIGDSSNGIFSMRMNVTDNATNATITNSGSITTIGHDSYGIISSGANATITNSGSITTISNNSFGIRSTGNYAINAFITNSGSITTSGQNSDGITSSGRNATITNSGTITTNDEYSYGIHSSISDTNATISNSNSISTSGFQSYGIYSEGDNATIRNSGSIYTTNNNSTGISSWGAFATIVNTGSITTLGDDMPIIISADGIASYTHHANISNSGIIRTFGPNAYGIRSYASYLTLSNSGTIFSSGSNSHGIFLTGEYSVINNSGSIKATDIGAKAIYLESDMAMGTANQTTLNLNKHSVITGDIFASSSVTGAKLNFNLGAGASYDYSVTGPWTIADLNNRPMVSGSAHAAGVGNVTTASQSLYERTSQITQSLDDRLRTHDLKQQPSQDFWINTYYSDSNRGGQGLSGSNLSFNQYRSGITAGFNVKNSYTPTELIVNYEHGQLNIDEGNQGISSNSVMAGALFPDIKKLFTGTLSAKAMLGYSDFSGDRKVLTNDVAFNGSRNVTASYQSSHLTIGSAWTKTLYQTDKIILDTLVGIDLNTQHINSYSESDLFKWNSRTINQLQERVTLGMEMKPFVKPLTLFGRVGVERRDLISGENQNYAINNTAVSYNDSNQRNTYATLNAGAYYPLTQTVKAYAQVRYYDSTKDIDSLSGSIGISGQF